MQAIEVTARWETEGRVNALSFTWQGHVYPVEETGRSWREADGLHLLVMAAGGRVFELVLLASDLKWYLASQGQVRAVV